MPDIMKIARTLQLLPLLEKKSHFLFGPRATGKSTLIRDQLKGYNCLIINLLRNAQYLDLSQAPGELESMIRAANYPKVVVIDEVQRVPELLNEVHHLIEEYGTCFLLTGSSARKLKKNGVNLLAGRARRANLFPLTSHEIADFDLMRYLRYGGLPNVYLSEEPFEELEAYADTYLKEEIQMEALVRNIPGFSKFLQTVAIHAGQMLNFSSVASDVGLSVSTVREYYYILEDTFLGFMLPAYVKTTKRKAISTAKFYLFDLGVRHYLAKINELPPGSEIFSQAMEHFIAMEIKAYLSYARQPHMLTYWQSKSGLEVDFVIGDDIAIEVKSATKISKKHLKGLLAFQQEKIAKRFIIVSLDPIHKHLDNNIEVIPCERFLKMLWDGELITTPSRACR